MAKLIMCKGLPASGKSTWAAQQQGAVVINKDDIRARMNKPWSRDLEKDVIKTRNFEICQALSAGKLVISSDTNFAPKHEETLRGLAKKYKAEFEIKDFTDVPIEVCLERDGRREEGQVGADVIRKMAEQYVVGIEKVKPKDGLPTVVICDLDGTLALKHEGRNIFDCTTADQDNVNIPVFTILEAMLDKDIGIIFVSGREDKYRESTKKFLSVKCGYGFPTLFMRSTGDFRHDDIIKREIFDREIRDKYNVLFVLDDRDRVVKMWRGLGLTCLQVAEGNF